MTEFAESNTTIMDLANKYMSSSRTNNTMTIEMPEKENPKKLKIAFESSSEYIIFNSAIIIQSKQMV